MSAIDRRTAGKLLAATAFAAAAPRLALAAETETERLNKFFEACFQRSLDRSPMRQSRLGIRKDQDKWDDVSEAARLQDIEFLRRDLATLHRFDTTKLEPQAKLSWRLFEYLANDQLKSLEWRRNDYLVTQMGGLHTRVATILLNSHPIASGTDARAYIARLHGVKPLMEQLVVELRRQEAAGVKPPKFIFPLLFSASENLLQGRPFDPGPADSPLFADFKTKIGKAALAQGEKDTLVAAAEAALLAGVGPGYRALLAQLRSAEATATGDAGVWKLPNGDDFYRAQLASYTTLPVAPDELHRQGLAEVARIQGEMRAILGRIGFAGTLQEFFVWVRKDPAQHYPDTDTGRAQCLADARQMLAEMQARQSEVLGRLPKAAVEVRAVEAWREKSAPKAFYSSPPEDGSQPGIFYVNLYDMGAAPKYELPVILYHEAVPGHHVETVVAQEIQGLPKFRRFASIAAYSEGWGLYSETLAREMGFYADPYQDFGRLSLGLMRAARLVVDTGLHAMRWTREQAIGYFDENLPGSTYDHQREIERYIVLPGQATSYQVGMMKILVLRQRARDALGERFDLRAFHDLILGGGPLPLPLLEERIDGWVKQNMAAVR